MIRQGQQHPTSFLRRVPTGRLLVGTAQYLQAYLPTTAICSDPCDCSRRSCTVCLWSLGVTQCGPTPQLKQCKGLDRGGFLDASRDRMFPKIRPTFCRRQGSNGLSIHQAEMPTALNNVGCRAPLYTPSYIDKGLRLLGMPQTPFSVQIRQVSASVLPRLDSVH